MDRSKIGDFGLAMAIDRFRMTTEGMIDQKNAPVPGMVEVARVLRYESDLSIHDTAYAEFEENGGASADAHRPEVADRLLCYESSLYQI